MKKHIRLIIGIFFLIVIFFPLSKVSADQMDRYDIDIFVRKNGEIQMTETREYDFGYTERHGIYREFDRSFQEQNPETGEMDTYVFDMTDFEVEDEKGNSYPYSISKTKTTTTIKVGDADILITGEHTYILSYTIRGAIRQYEDFDGFNWNILPVDNDDVISQFTGKIRFEDGLFAQMSNFNCYVGGYGSTSPCGRTDIKSVLQTISFSDSYLYSGVTVQFELESGSTTPIEVNRLIPFFETIVGQIILVMGFLVFLVFYIYFPIRIYNKWRKNGRDPKGVTGVVSAWFEPPKVEGKALLPLVVGGIIDEKIGIRELSATIVHLAMKGYIQILEPKKKEIELKKLKGFQRDSKLHEAEKYILGEIFGSQEQVKIKDLKLYSSVQKFYTKGYSEMMRMELFDRNPESTRNKYYLIGAFGIFTANLFLALTAFIFGTNLQKRTPKGVEVKNISRSLKNFLRSQKEFLNFQGDKKLLFEQLLPYAVVFGVEKHWAKRFKNLDLSDISWYSGNSNTFDAMAISSMISHSVHSLQSVATPPSSTSSISSSSSFSGGGFSGGGFGGGSSGSW